MVIQYEADRNKSLGGVCSNTNGGNRQKLTNEIKVADFLFGFDHYNLRLFVRHTLVHMCTKFKAARIKYVGVRAD